jgi:hypothetical protein
MTAAAFVEGNGRCRVEGTCVLSGGDLCVVLGGGERPHIGAAVVRSAYSGGTICLAGHRDDVPARAMAAKISAAKNITVCVVAGIHIDDASAEEIAVLLQNAEKIGDRIVGWLNGATEKISAETR